MRAALIGPTPGSASSVGRDQLDELRDLALELACLGRRASRCAERSSEARARWHACRCVASAGPQACAARDELGEGEAAQARWRSGSGAVTIKALSWLIAAVRARTAPWRVNEQARGELHDRLPRAARRYSGATSASRAAAIASSRSLLARTGDVATRRAGRPRRPTRHADQGRSTNRRRSVPDPRSPTRNGPAACRTRNEQHHVTERGRRLPSSRRRDRRSKRRSRRCVGRGAYRRRSRNPPALRASHRDLHRVGRYDAGLGQRNRSGKTVMGHAHGADRLLMRPASGHQAGAEL